MSRNSDDPDISLFPTVGQERRIQMRLIPVVFIAVFCQSLVVPSAQRAESGRTIIGLTHTSNVWLVGAYDPKSGWIRDDRARSLVKSGILFSLISSDGRAEKVSIGPIRSGDEVGGFLASIRTGKVPKSDGPTLAVGGGRAKLNRPWKRQPATNPLYRKAVADSLRQAGLKSVSSARVTQNIRVDLNGDGADEVLLCARSRDAMGRITQAVPGDYTFAGIRFVAKSGVKMLPLERHVHNGTWKPGAITFRYAFLPCTDLDGDGRMEIALYESYHEGDSITVYTFNGAAVKRVLTTGWGV